MTDITDITDTNESQLIDIEQNQALPTLEFNPDDYRGALEGLDITDEQANEFLAILFNIIHTLVDIGLGLDIVQMFDLDNIEKTGHDSGNTLLLEQGKTSFNEAADTTANKQED